VVDSGSVDETELGVLGESISTVEDSKLSTASDWGVDFEDFVVLRQVEEELGTEVIDSGLSVELELDLLPRNFVVFSPDSVLLSSLLFAMVVTGTELISVWLLKSD
jgi:hypothetical protein